MIFTPFDTVDFSLLSNLKKSIGLSEISLTVKEIIRPSEEAVRIRNIDCFARVCKWLSLEKTFQEMMPDH